MDALTFLSERRTLLQTELVAAQERVSILRGGLAEVEYALAQLMTPAEPEPTEAPLCAQDALWFAHFPHDANLWPPRGEVIEVENV
jgi:hypothetical protein